MQRVIVHIDSLVLKGFRHEDRHAFALGLQEELGRQFAEPGALHRLPKDGGLSRLNIGAVTVGLAADPGRTGTAVARGIGQGFKP